MQRVLIAGSSGAGKSTLARRLSDRLALPYVELDALFHGPHWTPRPSFLDDVGVLAAGERWVSEYQYPAARPLLLARADTVIWLDYRRLTVMQRLLRRSAGRALLRRPMFNGNTESFADWLRADHPLRHTWRHHADFEQRLLGGIERPGLDVLRFRRPAETDRWLTRLRIQA